MNDENNKRVCGCCGLEKPIAGGSWGRKSSDNGWVRHWQCEDCNNCKERSNPLTIGRNKVKGAFCEKCWKEN